MFVVRAQFGLRCVNHQPILESTYKLKEHTENLEIVKYCNENPKKEQPQIALNHLICVINECGHTLCRSYNKLFQMNFDQCTWAYCFIVVPCLNCNLEREMISKIISLIFIPLAVLRRVVLEIICFFTALYIRQTKIIAITAYILGTSNMPIFVISNGYFNSMNPSSAVSLTLISITEIKLAALCLWYQYFQLIKWRRNVYWLPPKLTKNQNF